MCPLLYLYPPVTAGLPGFPRTNAHDTEMPGTWQEAADDMTREGFVDKIIICCWTQGLASFLGRGAATPDKCPFV